MSSIEERLARDIAAVTQGVVVTESDLRVARDAVEDRIVIGRESGRRRTLAAVAAAAVVVPILGFGAYQTLGDHESAPPANPGPTSPIADDTIDEVAVFLTGSIPTPELLQGVWRVDDGTVLLRFSPPNLVSFDDAGRLYSDPAGIGTYEIAGDLITVTVDGGSAECAGQTFAMRASLPELGTMRLVHTQPGTANCSPHLEYGYGGTGAAALNERWVLEQVLPTNNEYLSGLMNSGVRGWQPLSDRTNVLYGDWMAEGGGHILELAPGGAYYVADESGEVVDRGQWSQGSSDLTLTSSAASAECSDGDRLVLGGVEQLYAGTTVIRGSVEQNTCGAAWTPRSWILLPHTGS